MPERILRDLTDSERYNCVSVHARDLFIRLINKADDYGLYYADAKRLRPSLYPLLLDQTRESDLQRWIAECVRAGLVRVFESAGRQYLQVSRWRQRLRNKNPKHPVPPWGHGPQPDDSQLPDDCPTYDGHPRTESDIGDGGAVESGVPPGAIRFWQSYPQIGRGRSSQKKVRDAWKAQKCEEIVEAVFDGLRKWIASADWQKDGGRFAVAADRWLRERRWENPPPPAEVSEIDDDRFSPGFVPETDIDKLAAIAFGEEANEGSDGRPKD